MRRNIFCNYCVCALLVFGFLFCMHPAAYGAVTGKISGMVTDAESGEPLPGVNIIIEGTVLGAATSSEGEYFILGVPPGFYSVTASIIGYQKLTITDVAVRVDRTTNVDFQMKTTALEAGEEVTVTAERPIIIKDLTATATTTGAEMMEVIPIESTRSMIDLNAGILRDTQDNIIIRGGEVNQLKFYVDGVSMEKLGSHEWSLASQGTGATGSSSMASKYQFNVLGVQEMEVITGGFNAEYGDAQSGIVNVVTKEGGGSYHGDFRIEHGLPGQYHFGPYLYDHNVQPLYLNWDDFSAWEDWNSRQQDPSALADSLPIWYERWKVISNPSWGHRGGIYPYKETTYKRTLWGVGGPIVGNKFTFYFSGELRNKPEMVPVIVKYWNYYNLDFNTTYRITPKMKLKSKVYAIHYRGFLNYAESNMSQTYKTSFRSTAFWARRDTPQEWYTTGESITWTHTLSPTTFYEVLLSHNRDQRIGAPTDAGNPDARAWWIPRGPWYSNFNAPGPGDNTTQAPADGDFHNYRYKLDFISQLDPHNQIKAGTEGRIYNGYNWVGGTGGVMQWADATWRGSAYDLTPRYFSAYVQDKMEYGGMIANLGIRWDRYDAHTDVPVDRYDPMYVLNMRVRGNPAKEPSVAHDRISPRLGFSHPISENTAFHFQYGHFYQIPDVDLINNYGTYGNGFIGYPNANIEPGRTVSYEFGLQHNLRGTHRINLVLYINDLTDQPRSRLFYMPNVGNSSARYMTNSYENFGYGSSKGFELTLDRTAIGNWHYRATYTLARVFVGAYGPSEQYSDDPNDPRNWTRRQSARTTLRSTDRTHRLTGIISYRTPQEWGSLWGEWEFGLNAMVQSGTPYTYTMSYEESLSLVYNRNWPMQQLTDLSIKKWINMGRVRPQLYVRITNLFNNKMMRQETGGTTPKNWAQYNSIWEDTTDSNYLFSNYQFYMNEKRRILLGLGFSF